MDIFLLLLRLALATVFAVAAFGKIFDRPGSEKALADFGVPEFLQVPLAKLLPVAELAVVIALLFVSSSWFGAVGGAVLLIIFLGGMFYQVAQGKAPDCHCFGQLHSEPVGSSSVVRNLVMLAMTGFLMGQGREYQGFSLVNSNQDIMQFIVGLTVIGLLGATVFLIRRILNQQTEIVRHLEMMELERDSASSVERAGVSHPHEGLPIGAKFPDFELPGINGDMVTLDVIMAARMPALFFFISPTCTPCRSLVPEFEQWQSDLKDKVNLVFVSSGTPEVNEEKFGESIKRQLLIQKNRELADATQAKWTPTAVFVNRNGRVASHAAAGDKAIRELVEKINSEDLEKEHIHFAVSNEDGHQIRIGQKVPDFSLQDLNGRTVTSEIFNGKSTIVTFWDVNCGHCKHLLNDLREWDRSRKNGDPELLVFSDGDAEPNAALGFSSLVIDEGYKVAEKMGMFGTPSAVVVNQNGIIISETAIGARDLWALIGKQN